MNSDNYVVVIGGANVDIGGTPYKEPVDNDSNPGRITIAAGGVARNIAHNLVLLGINVKFITAIGNDPLGTLIQEDCRSAGIDTSCALIADDCNSSMYMYINDEEGDLQLAVSDMDICSHITPEYIDEYSDVINGAYAVVADCNLSSDTLKRITEICTSPVYVDTVSVNKSSRVLGCLDGLYAIKPNMKEAEIIAGMKIDNPEDCMKAAEKILDRGVQNVFISMVEHGMLAADRNDMYVADRYDAHVVSTNGAGDSAMAAIIWSAMMCDGIISDREFLNNISANEFLPLAAHAANAAASITISAGESVNKELSEQRIVEIITNNNNNIK